MKEQIFLSAFLKHLICSVVSLETGLGLEPLLEGLSLVS